MQIYSPELSPPFEMQTFVAITLPVSSKRLWEVTGPTAEGQLALTYAIASCQKHASGLFLSREAPVCKAPGWVHEAPLPSPLKPPPPPLPHRPYDVPSPRPKWKWRSVPTGPPSLQWLYCIKSVPVASSHRLRGEPQVRKIEGRGEQQQTERARTPSPPLTPPFRRPFHPVLFQHRLSLWEACWGVGVQPPR